MLRFRIFFGLLLVGLVLLDVLHQAPAWAPDAFASNDAVRLQTLSALPSQDVVELKLQHAAAVPRYDYGLFGNSRAIEVAAADVPFSRFFNFAISASSFRTSVQLLERLAAIGKAPRVAFIQFDNPLAMHRPSGPWDSDLLSRWEVKMGDLLAALGDELVTTEDWIALAGDAVAEEWDRFTSLFSVAQLRVRLHFLWPSVIPWSADVLAHQADGSRRPDEPDGPLASSSFERTWEPPIPALDRYMERLSAISQRYGIRVIVFESPVHPVARAHFASEPSEVLVARRRGFLNACQLHEVDCRVDIALPLPPPYWSVWEHPPGPLLGSWLEEVARD